MKKVSIVLIIVTALAMAFIPVSAEHAKIPSYPTIQISAPESAAVGDEITIKITVNHKNSDANNHIKYVWLYENYRTAETWTYGTNEAMHEDHFTLTYTTVITEDTTFFAYMKSTLHGSSAVMAHVEVEA
jgi:hypothetical protein